MQLGKEVNIEITNINHQGEGVGRLEGMVIFVPGTVPGERVVIRIGELRKNYARGIPIKITSPSKHREIPACNLSARCGGCSLQHINYQEQLRLKTEIVRQNIARIGGVTDAVVRDIIGMQNPWQYRNNIRFKVQRNSGGIELGFFAQDSHLLIRHDDTSNDEILCMLAHRDLNRVAVMIRSILEDNGSNVELPEEIMLRCAGSGEVMVVLIGKAEKKKTYVNLASKIASLPGVVSVVENIRVREQKSSGKYKTLCGKEYIEDELDGLRYRISAASFYQVNPLQTALLYKKVLDYCALQGDENVVDAYCGVGTITLYIARYARAVQGYEITPSAVRDAEINASLSGINNAQFFRGAVERVLPEHVAKGYRPDVVVLDPPRNGCRPEVIEALAESKASRVVYVSCNPATLARDIKLLTLKGYELQEVQPVDMFPHTGHVECCALLTRYTKG